MQTASLLAPRSSRLNTYKGVVTCDLRTVSSKRTLRLRRRCTFVASIYERGTLLNKVTAVQ